MSRRGCAAVLAIALAALVPEPAGGAGAAHLAVVQEAPDVRPADPVLEALRADLDRVLSGPAWRRAEWGMLAVSLDAGDTLWARNADQRMIPASNVKLFTTAAALHHLGADYRYRTYLVSEGRHAGGVLDGDLVVYGTGDPGIGDRFYPSRTAVFDSLAAALHRSGVREVRGAVLGDGTFFTGPDRVDSWDPADLNDWFAAASPALSYNENVVTFRVAASRPGLPPVVHTLPDHGGVPFVNAASTAFGTPRARLLIGRDDPSLPTRIEGEISATGGDAWRRMTVQDPVLHAAHAMHAALERAGIRVSGQPSVVGDPGESPLTGRSSFVAGGPRPLRVLAEHTSPPLAEYLAVINRESHNLFADLVLRTLGRVVAGEGSYEAGARVVERFLVTEAGVAEGSVSLSDGSGLADLNRATPVAFVALLEHLARDDRWNDFRATLPEAGSRGFTRMRRTPAAGRLWAKTGTIRGVSALSGVVETEGGERVAFSLIGNRLPSAWAAKRLEDQIGARLASLRRSAEPGRATLGRSEPASKFEN